MSETIEVHVNEHTPIENEPKGIGGWLILVIIGYWSYVKCICRSYVYTIRTTIEETLLFDTNTASNSGEYDIYNAFHYIDKECLLLGSRKGCSDIRPIDTLDIYTDVELHKCETVDQLNLFDYMS